MAAIFGQCPRCPQSKRPVRLYGGLCNYHFANHGQDQSGDKVTKEVLQKDMDDKLIKKWYLEQLSLVPEVCENCQGPFLKPSKVSPRVFVAHIVPKSKFLSVMVHPLNRWFSCYDCHNKFDQEGWGTAILMPVWPICVDRFRQFMALIKPGEFKYLPPALSEILHSTG